MKSLFIFTFGLLSLVLTEQQWEKFTVKEGRFSVMVPGEMEEKIRHLETKIGTLSYHSFVYQSKEKDADNLVYIVSYCDYPEHTVHADSTELLVDFFDATIESSVESVDGELAYTSDNFMGGYPAKLWRVNYNENAASIKSKACMVGNRYYTVQTVTLIGKGRNRSIEKFMDSFVVLSAVVD